MGHLPSDVAPDLRSRDYRIEADVVIRSAPANGVLIAHGDSTSGYSLYLEDGYLLHDLNIGGEHVVLKSDRRIDLGEHVLGLTVTRRSPEDPPKMGVGMGQSRYELFYDGNVNLCNQIYKLKLENIKIFYGNVIELLDELKIDEYFSEIWILFPDPWPKKRHQKRRLINLVFLKKIYDFLKDNGKIFIATDSINDTHIDWYDSGNPQANQISTADVPENVNLYYNLLILVNNYLKTYSI